MPAPPSSAQQAASRAARSTASKGPGPQGSFGGYKGPSGAPGNSGAPRGPGGQGNQKTVSTGPRTDRAPSTTQGSSSRSITSTPNPRGISTPTASGSPVNNPVGEPSRLSSRAEAIRQAAIQGAARARVTTVPAGTTPHNPALETGQGPVADQRVVNQPPSEALPNNRVGVLRDNYSQYRSPPLVETGYPRPGTGLVTSNVATKVDLPGTQNAPINPFDAVYGPPKRVGVIDAPRLSADPTNGVAQYPGAGIPDLPVRGQTQYMTDRLNPPPARQTPEQALATQQAINNAIHRNTVTRIKQVYVNESPDDIGAALSPLDGPRPAGPEGQAPGIVSTNPRVPIPREKPVVSIGEVLRSIAPAVQVPVPRAKPTPPSPAAPDGIYGPRVNNPNLLGQTDASMPLVAQIYDDFIGNPPEEDIPNLDIGTGEDLPTPPKTFAQAPPAVRSGLADIITQLTRALGRPKESVVEISIEATPDAVEQPKTRSIGEALSKPFEKVAKPIQNVVEKVTGKTAERAAVSSGADIGIRTDRQPPIEKGAPLGPGGGERNRNSVESNSKESDSPNPKDWEGKGYTAAEIAHLQTLSGKAYKKELERLKKLYKNGGGTIPSLPTDFSQILAKYLADQQRILAGNGYGLIPI